DLYEAYPDFDIDVEYEQNILLQHDIIIMQHPFYWYSAPPIVKQWIDLVFEHGWAYGKNGKALAGKKFMNAISTGGRQEAYVKGGFNQFTIRDFLAPFEQTARLCNMIFLPPFVIHGTHLATGTDIDQSAQLYRSLLINLSRNTLSIDRLEEFSYINEIILNDNIIKS
ncbi:MAG: NAD(P)H oxidoreductase, partial [Bacteroidales bacterium]|nr:NAD(P)H oxidoreductase [Bacteroidales bacterium]